MIRAGLCSVTFRGLDVPRVVELATGSMQYREKAAACELLLGSEH